MGPTILATTVNAAQFSVYTHPISVASNTEAFRTGIDRRDGPACVVCGHRVPHTQDHCHIVPKTDPGAWEQLRQLHWIPAAAKSVEHECRNGVIMCKNHHHAFDNFQYFVRFVPERQEYVFCNFLNHPEYDAYHDCPLRLDPSDARAPFSMAFHWQERIARARNPAFGSSAALTLTPPRPPPIAGNERSSPTTPTQARVRPPVAVSPVSPSGAGGGSGDDGGSGGGGGFGRSWVHNSFCAPMMQDKVLQPETSSSVASSALLSRQVPLPEVDLALWTSLDYWRAQGHRNWDNISQEGDDYQKEYDGVRKWGESAEENIRLWTETKGVSS
ncbi:hypothetical protein K440DRAFT_583369 [Wilcoxina mikolae CBS 423.85]|nr:hypothetical protein K440DRAFT_583369 [Wilcoxina mikolae CBS 423.85]